MMAISLISGSKKSKKGDDDPAVGYRYWADAMFAVATLPMRTTAAWVNRVYQQGEEYTEHKHNKRGNYGEYQKMTVNTHVNTFVTTGFWLDASWISHLAPDGGFRDVFSEWQYAAPQQRKIVLCSHKSQAQSVRSYMDMEAVEKNAHKVFEREFPTHDNGVLMVYGSQVYMGLNSATLQSYTPVVTVLPGSILYLAAHIDWANPDTEVYNSYLVRTRLTQDLAWVYSVNPVCIVTDLLIEHTPFEAIDWKRCAAAAVELITKYPYMWFSMTISQLKMREALQKVLTAAKLYVYRTRVGKLAVGVTGTSAVYDGVDTCGVGSIDLKRDVTTFSLSKNATATADIVNEMRGEYQAARITSTPPPTEMHLRPGDRVNEGHMLPADMHVLNAGNIVLTGVRKQQTQDLSFLAWPDDAHHYLWDAMTQQSRAYLSGSVTGSFWLAQFPVGAGVHLYTTERHATTNEQFLTFNKKFRVTERSFDGYPSETVTLNLEEAPEWQGKFDPCVKRVLDGPVPLDPPKYPWAGGDPWQDFDGSPILPDQPAPNNPPGTGDVGHTPPPPPVELVKIPFFLFATSADLLSVPAMVGITSNVVPRMDSYETFITADCQPDTPALEPEPIFEDNGPFPMVAYLDEDVAFPNMYPGLISGKEINTTIMCPPIEAYRVHATDEIAEMTVNFGAQPHLMYNAEEPLFQNYILFSKATAANPHGNAVCCRAQSISTALEGTAIKVRIRGLIAVDSPTNLSFSKGDAIAILPIANAKTAYNFSHMPMPDFYPLVRNRVNTTVYFRTLLRALGEKQPWAEGYCDDYIVDGHHLKAKPATVYGFTGSDAPSSEAVFLDSANDAVTFIVSAADYITLRENPSVPGIYVGGTSSLGIMSPVRELKMYKQHKAVQSGISDVKITAVFKDKVSGATLLTEELTSHATMPSFVLANADITSKHLTTEFHVKYMLTSLASDEPIQLDTAVSPGPDVIIA